MVFLEADTLKPPRASASGDPERGQKGIAFLETP
jgi:hypothetical protein